MVRGYGDSKWLGTKDGRYTIASGYSWLLNAHTRFDMNKVVWHSYALPKHAFIVWLVSKGRLLTMDRINNWTTGYGEGMCMLCHVTDETHLHLFFQCSYSTQLLRLVSAWLGLQGVQLVSITGGTGWFI